jgi:glycosyltransferase involved in cell wall biosynthesis
LVQDEKFLTHVELFKPDALVHFCSYSWPVARFAKSHGIPAVFRSHNYEPSFFWEELESVARWNPVNWIRYMAKRRGERNAVKCTSAVATIPFADIWRYRAWKPDGIFPLTLTYLPQSLRDPHMHEGKKPLDVFYLGASYRVSFHLRGAAMLVEDIAPRVLARAPGAFRFHICGAKLPQYLVEKCDGVNIIYEGYVPDLEKFLEGMDIGAFPVFTGKVMKGKVFESLARGFPIVIPRVCMAEYELAQGKEVLLAESVDEFVEAIVTLKSDEKRAALSRGAHAFATEHFSHETLTKSLSQALDVAKARMPLCVAVKGY